MKKLRRLAPLAVALLAVLPAAAPVSAEAEDAKRPAHIHPIAWRDRMSDPVYSSNHRPVNRTRHLARAFHPKRIFLALRSLWHNDRDD